MTSVPVPGARIAVHEYGAGPPVVLVHGGTGTADHDWAPLLPWLRERFRTVTFDLRGHGGSPDPDGRLGMSRFGLDVTHVLRALGIPRAVLIGFSVGGNSLLTLLARQPGLATALVVIGASAHGDAARVRQILSGPWPEELTDLRHDAADGPDYWKRLRATLAEDWAENLSLDDEALRRITCPTLVCHGDADRVQRLEEALHLFRTLPDADLFVVPGAGHQLQLEQPALFLAGLERFLTDAVRRA